MPLLTTLLAALAGFPLQYVHSHPRGVFLSRTASVDALVVPPADPLRAATGGSDRAPDPTNEQRLKDSRAAWEKLRDKCGGDYRYEASSVSVFGFGDRTTLTVRGNKVVERTFEEVKRERGAAQDGLLPEAPGPKWVEGTKDLGFHTREGAPVRTVDELYDDAEKLLAAPLKEGEHILLRFDDLGLLRVCYLMHKELQDATIPSIEITVKGASATEKPVEKE